jgi:creatinine amidohydrolase/Fe(II)-dependent formamide hydrolase-like protein
VIAGHGGQVGDLDEATSELEAEARDLEAERRDS